MSKRTGMNRNQSINKIAPHLSTSFAAVNEVRKPDAISFSPYFSNAQEKDANEQGVEQEVSSKENAGSPQKKSAETSFPEIFTLIANPDFSEFFALSLSKDGAKLMFIVKKVRKDRGITKLLPIPKTKIAADREVASYLNTNARFAIPKGKQFTGKM